MTDDMAFSPRPASAPSDDGLVADLFVDAFEEWHGRGCGCSACFKSNLPPPIVFPALSRVPDPPTRREVVRLARKLQGRERDLLRHGSRAVKRASRSG